MDHQMDAWLVKADDESRADDIHPHAMNGPRRALIAVGVFFTLLGGCSVLCRIIALVKRQRRPYHDDWTLFAAFFFSIGFAISSFVSVRWGLGLHIDDVLPSWAARAIQTLYVCEIFYYASIFLIKMSIMFLYWRLASEFRNHFYYGTVVTIAVLCTHFLTTIIVLSVQCIPLEKYWNPTASGHCINITAFFYSTNVFTIATDLVMLALPMRTVWKLKRPGGQKVGVIAAFMCGGLSTLASCSRLYSIRIYTESAEPVRDAVPIGIWSFIEINVGVCCASVAVIKQLVIAVRNGSLTSPPARRRSTRGEAWQPPRSPGFGVEHVSTRETVFSRWSRDTDDSEVGKDLDGSPVRQSARLPPSPRFGASVGSGEMALPQRPDQPVLRTFITWEHDGESLTNLKESLADMSQSV